MKLTAMHSRTAQEPARHINQGLLHLLEDVEAKVAHSLPLLIHAVLQLL